MTRQNVVWGVSLRVVKYTDPEEVNDPVSRIIYLVFRNNDPVFLFINLVFQNNDPVFLFINLVFRNNDPVCRVIILAFRIINQRNSIHAARTSNHKST